MPNLELNSYFDSLGLQTASDKFPKTLTLKDLRLRASSPPGWHPYSQPSTLTKGVALDVSSQDKAFRIQSPKYILNPEP